MNSVRGAHMHNESNSYTFVMRDCNMRSELVKHLERKVMLRRAVAYQQTNIHRTTREKRLVGRAVDDDATVRSDQY